MNKLDKLAGKIAGGNSDIGLARAEQFAAQGATHSAGSTARNGTRRTCNIESWRSLEGWKADILGCGVGALQLIAVFWGSEQVTAAICIMTRFML